MQETESCHELTQEVTSGHQETCATQIYLPVLPAFLAADKLHIATASTQPHLHTLPGI